MKSFLPLCCIILLFSGILAGCNDDDFSTSSSDQPRFSQDTLSFDTVITTVGSSTKRVLLYNRGDKPLLISSIYLGSGGTSGFMINVDGSPGAEFSDVELDKKDSLYIFAEVKLPLQQSDTPQEVKDDLYVVTNGVTQRMVLTAYGQDAVMMTGRTLSQDTVITAGKPLVIYDSLCVAEGVTLTCLAGARLMFHSGAQLKVKGTLITHGATNQKVIFRGDRTDRLFSYLPYDRTPGQWEGIRFYRSSTGNQLTGVDIHSANTALICDSTGLDVLKLTLLHSIVNNSADYNLKCHTSRVEILNSLLVNTGRNTVYLADGDYTFLQTTIVNYYQFGKAPGTASATLLVSSNYEDGERTPHTRVSFTNCIVPLADEAILHGNKDGITLTYHSCVNDEKNYVNLNNNGDYWYDFRPTAKNACLDAADPHYAYELPLDLDGYPRFSDNAPDAGCYEYRRSE